MTQDLKAIGSVPVGSSPHTADGQSALRLVFAAELILQDQLEEFGTQAAYFCGVVAIGTCCDCRTGFGYDRSLHGGRCLGALGRWGNHSVLVRLL